MVSFPRLTHKPSVYPVVGSVTGGFTGFRPGFSATSGGFVGSSGPGCVYKSQVYKQGETWDDGCDFSCECVDAAQRRFLCTPKCKQYTYIPPTCQKVPDPQGCCELVVCPDPKPPTTTLPPTCKDTRSDCNLYGSAGSSGCIGQYEPWARVNCAATCNYCPTPSAPTTTPTSGCLDAIPNCQDYGQNACSGVYGPWAAQNCKKYCNLCKPTPGSGQQCFDLLDTCGTIGPNYCSGVYEPWAQKNCNSTCNLCKSAIITGVVNGISGTGGPGSIVGGTNITWGSTSSIGWTLLLKGVSGAPGDLWPLWQSQNTSNARNPLAMELTDRLKENYKPDISNYWNDCKFDLIRLSLMTDGHENAYILFDSKGADKLSWFDSKRIVNSSFTDLTSANFDAFTASGDPNAGRHFVITEHTRSCDVKGWLIMSTRQNCFFERGVLPGFHYSDKGQATQFIGTDTQRADIMVITGHGGKCGLNGTSTPGRAVCPYKGKEYNTGDEWQDGCDKKCKCIDANVGYFKCDPLCPVIKKLAYGCRIAKRPGQCCGEVVCDQTPGCYYKGGFHIEGEKWEDGCDYNCECMDGVHGFFQCTQKCITFKNLPKECQLLAAPPGKCCSTPSCPPGISIDYPDDYVPQ